MGVMLSIWLGTLAWDIYESKTYKEDTEQDTKFLTQQILVFSQTIAERPAEISRMIRKIEDQRKVHFKERNLYAPRLLIQVWKGRDIVYASSPELGIALPPRETLEQTPQDNWASWTEADTASGITVRIAQEITGKWAFTISSVGYYLLPLLYSFPFLLLPAWFIIKIGLRPLETIVTEIEGRNATDLSPLAESPYKELATLVNSINRLMERLTERLEREQEFLLDAAHELKTPLAIIQINADSLAANRDPKRMQEANYGLHQGVTRATHTVHQLLALARSGGDRDNAELQPMNLVELVGDRLALAAPLALQRAIEMEMLAPDACVLPLHRESMASLVDNLISNAVKYSPDKGHIVVCVTARADGARLTVTDQGPGIPPELRKKVFERFFRLPGQDQAGSGLGLAIAERAAMRNNARIHLDTGPAGTGLTVLVDFLRNGPETQGTEGA